MNTKKRLPLKQNGSPARKEKRRTRKYTFSEKAKERNRLSQLHGKTTATKGHNSKVNQLGMFRVLNHESQESIQQAIEDCGNTSKHLVLPSCLLRAFDGDLYKAAVVSFLLYMEEKLHTENSNWFVAKYPQIESFTGAKRKRIVNIMKELREIGIIETARLGIPAMQHYVVDKDMLIQLCMERVLNYQDPLLELGIAEVV